MYILFFLIIIFLILFKLNWYYTNFEYYGLIIKNSHIPDFTRWILSDKFIAKEYAKLNGFDVPKTYQLVKFPHQIKFNYKNFVLKPTDLCDSAGVYLIKDNKNTLTNKVVDKQKIIQELQNLRSSIKTEYYMHEYMYNGLIPFSGYIVEELLLDENNNIPCDLKCYVFGGKLHYIAKTYNRRIINGEQKFDSIWLDRNWEPIKTKMIKKGYVYQEIKKPINYQKIVMLVENMGKILRRHCRIDIYVINDKIYLGEFTFFCGARIHTFICNYKLGKIWLDNPDDYHYEDKRLKKLVPNFYNIPN